ncbi:MAG: hypothetical protein JSR33_08560 [Proteobacteria bacterium]|nr:hypothetical protein [Pseudomonadota bacterium]
MKIQNVNYYKKTDLILKILAAANLLLLPLLIWSVWQWISMAFYGKAYSFLITLLTQGVGVEALILCLTAWAFLNHWRWFLFLYIPYSIYMLPLLIPAILDYHRYSQFNSAFYFPSKLYTWLHTGLILAICLTCLLFLFEIYRFKKTSSR